VKVAFAVMQMLVDAHQPQSFEMLVHEWQVEYSAVHGSVEVVPASVPVPVPDPEHVYSQSLQLPDVGPDSLPSTHEFDEPHQPHSTYLLQSPHDEEYAEHGSVPVPVPVPVVEQSVAL
jgi:hypothetical protein